MSAVEKRPSTVGAVTHLGPGGKVPQELRDLLTPAGVAAAGANIVMQLALLPVGRGVAESRVPSGSLYEHPIKRARTTFGYVMVAIFGTDEERAALGREVTAVHRHVRSRPDDAVAYNAADPELQLWVAACIYRGLEDVHRAMYGPPADALLNTIYPHAARLATTLQVPADMWPADRDAFESYWQETTARIRMDDVTRAYLYDFAGLGFLPWPIPPLFGPLHRILTAGFLPEPFRRELGLPWEQGHRRVFSATMAVARAVNACTPRRLRALPFDVYLWDTRRRIRTGRRVL